MVDMAAMESSSLIHFEELGEPDRVLKNDGERMGIVSQLQHLSDAAGWGPAPRGVLTHSEDIQGSC